MKTYKLLTPGPLTTTMTVKEQMLFDHCTWNDDYKQITQWIRAELVRIANCSPETYTAVLMQGSGTFGDEAALTSVVGDDEKVLICSNGAYGDRMVEACRMRCTPSPTATFRTWSASARCWTPTRRSPTSAWCTPRPPRAC